MAPKPRKQKKTRAEKAAENRQSLLDAAAEVIGEEGYLGASVARITQRAGLAQGTFYQYFDSQQDLFDQLLPTLGSELLDYLSQRIHGTRDVLEVEEAGFRGFFEFLQQNPSFFRVLNEETAKATSPRCNAAGSGASCPTSGPRNWKSSPIS